MHAVESMMYAGATPWHGLGRYVGDDALTAEDAIVAAGLDWEVGCQPVFAEYDKDGSHIEVPDSYAVIRDTDRKVLGVVGKNYTPIQNTQCFEFMDEITGPERLVRYHTAGSLHGGKKVWLLAELTNLTFAPVPNDEVQPYLALIDSKDGSMSLTAFFTGVRIVCQNTANFALSKADKNKMVKIRHTQSAMVKMGEAQRVLGLAVEKAQSYGDVMTSLARKQFTQAKWNDFLDNLVGELVIPGEGEPTRGYTRLLNRREKLTELFESGIGTDIPGVRGTAWGAYNAITEFTTHHNQIRLGVEPGTEGYDLKRTDRRLSSSWFGPGDKMNTKALELLVGA
ncbi:MAG: hypothetical protein Tp1123DCM257201_32 [Prokaryotic dsDNA virus sp.]|nr:MAG: hypothetical protein Tp1123DCM257201_32 [Prokaryotic dsDNA virus sp.]|tara:strand:- start:862 stop:1878 length:1017 start_codon:yes stop_codon:yes gene_type:complete